MEPFALFEHSLQEMLSHLYDPAYRPPDQLWQTLHVAREDGLPALRAVIVAAIEEGSGKRLDWDGKTGRFTNDDAANTFLSRPSREGWGLS